MIDIMINGVEQHTSATTLARLLEDLELTEKRIAVEVNGILISKHKHSTYLLCKNDRIEIVHAVGGG